MLYLCAQVHIAWFDREYIYIYMADRQPRNRLALEKLSRVAMLAMVHSILFKFDVYDCQNGDRTFLIKQIFLF